MNRWFTKGGMALLLLLSLFLVAGCTKVVTTDGAVREHTLSINGEGRVSAAPDTALLSLGVSVLRDTVSQALDAAARSMTAVLDSLTANDVDESDVTTTQFRIVPEFDFSPDAEPTLLGFRVTNNVTAKIRDIDAAGAIIDDAVAAAGNDIVINNIAFTIDDPAPLAAQAREHAMEDARRKADALAQLSGVMLGDIITISESGGAASRAVTLESRGLALDQAIAAPTPISGGEIAISLSVFVTYAIDD